MTAEDLHNKYLPDRTTHAIINIAVRMGLNHKSYNYKRYTEKEIDILKMWSGVISVKEIHEIYLPNRSEQSIYQKIRSLGLLQYKNILNIKKNKYYCET